MEKKKLPPGILFIQFLVLMCYSSMAVLALLPLYFESLGGKPWEIGFFIGLFSFAAFFSRPVGGWLLSKMSPKKILVAGLFLGLGSTLSYLFVEKLSWILGFIRIVHGAGFSIFILAALLIAVLKSREEERAYALGVVSTGFMLPLLFMPFLGEQVIDRFGYFSFFLTATFLMVIPFVFALTVKIRLPQVSEKGEEEGSGFIRLLKQKRIVLILLMTFIFEVGLSSSFSFVPLLAHEDSSMRAGFFYTFLGLTAVFLRLYGGRRFKLWGSVKLLLPAFIFLPVGSLLTSLSFGDLMLSFSGVVWGLGTGILYPHLSALCVEGVGSKEKGKVLSLFAGSVDIGFGIGPLSFGWISQFFGLRQTFILFALFILFTSLPIIFIFQKIKKK